MVSRAIGDSYLKKLVVSEPSLNTYKISKRQNRIASSWDKTDYLTTWKLKSYIPVSIMQCLDDCVVRSTSVGTAISRGSNDNVTLVAIPLCEKLKIKNGATAYAHSFVVIK